MRGGEPGGHLGVLQAAVFSGRRVRLGYRRSGQREPAERIVDPYGLVCKAGIWYLVADQRGEPRLFRLSRVASAEAADEPAPGRLAVTVRVRRSVLDMFGRICAANLAGTACDDADPEWAVLPLRFPMVPAARTLLSFGGDVEVLSPPEVRADLARVAADVAARYT